MYVIPTLFLILTNLMLIINKQVLLAMMSLFGQLWIAGVLNDPPDAKTFRQKAQRLKTRMELTDRELIPLLNTFQPCLVFSIILFVVGTLYQSWDLAARNQQGSTILFFTGALSTIFASIAAAIVIRSVRRALHIPDSPFSEPISNGMMKVLRWMPKIRVHKWKILVKSILHPIPSLKRRLFSVRTGKPSIPPIHGKPDVIQSPEILELEARSDFSNLVSKVVNADYLGQTAPSKCSPT